MTTLGVPQLDQTPTLVVLECGHEVLFLPPVPRRSDELTCQVCGDPTEVR